MPAAAPANRNDPCPCGSGKKYKRCCMTRAGTGPAGAAPSAPAGDEPQIERAMAQLRAGNLAAARAGFEQVLARRPGDPAACFGLGRVLGQTGDTEAAIALLERAVAGDAARAGYHVALADQLLRSGRPDAAEASVRRAIDLDPRHPPAHRLLADCHHRLHRLDEALAAARRAVTLAPDYVNGRIVLGALLSRAGDHDAARTELERVIADGGSPEYMFRAWKELGLVLERLGEHDASFDAYRRGNREQAGTAPARRLDPAPLTAQIARYRTGCTPALLARWTPEGVADGGPPPAFLVGFPRSGTSMTEQVLAAHPDVTTSDEQPILQAAMQEMVRTVDGRDIPEMLERLSREDVRRLRARYRRAVAEAAGAAGPGRVFVDKLPLNIIHLGVIAVLFPDARVVVALRDPRDVCVSCFATRLDLNPAMVNFLDWERTAAFYAEVMDLYLHQRDLVPMPLIEVRYEDTVRDLPGQARRLLEHLGVAWDEAVLRFHETARERSVATPSFAAVTEPVHTRAVSRWRRFTAWVDEVAPALDRFIDAFGYRNEPPRA
jgi:tetratricopeptide (TPR) repeat protein